MICIAVLSEDLITKVFLFLVIGIIIIVYHSSLTPYFSFVFLLFLENHSKSNGNTMIPFFVKYASNASSKSFIVKNLNNINEL